MADALTSVTAIIALLTAKYFGWIWMDPLMGIVGSLLVAKWSIGLLKQTSRTLLDHQASSEVVNAVRHAIEEDDHTRITDLHVWSIGLNQYAVILAVTSKSPLSAEAYRARLDEDQFPHTTVEIVPFER
jgi:cation diffusion facilitator family transporter